MRSRRKTETLLHLTIAMTEVEIEKPKHIRKHFSPENYGAEEYTDRRILGTADMEMERSAERERERKEPVDESREASSPYSEAGIGGAADVDDLEGDVLAFSVAIEPEDEPLAAAGLLLQGALERELVGGDELADGGVVELRRVAGAPFPEALLEVELHEVPGDGGHGHGAFLAPHVVLELEDLVVHGVAMAAAQAGAARQDLGHGPRH